MNFKENNQKINIKIKSYNVDSNVNKDIFKSTEYDDIPEIDFSIDPVHYLDKKIGEDPQTNDESNLDITVGAEEQKNFFSWLSEFAPKSSYDKPSGILYNLGQVINGKEELSWKVLTDGMSVPAPKSTIWSSFYGGSSKHTLDHIGGLFKWPGTKFDMHNRNISSDRKGNKYINGVQVDEKGRPVKDGIKTAFTRFTSFMNNNKAANYTAKIFTGGTYSSISEIQQSLKEFQKGKQLSGLDGSGSGVYIGGGLDDKIANSKLGKFVSNYNVKHGHGRDTKFGSDNQYRVGQNWAYGSVNFANLYSTGARESLLGNDWKTEGEYGGASGGVHLGYGEVSVKANMGPDHIVASASAEVSALHLEGKADYGLSGKNVDDSNDYFGWVPDDITIIGASASGEADLAKAYANGKIGLGVYKGADGKPHLDAGIQASVGADLCSASGSVTGKVMGVGVGVQGAVKIGVGAQANLGFEDGKLNVHLGLAVGVGVEVGFSLDVSEITSTLYEPVKGMLDSAVEGVSSFVSWLNPFD